MKLSNGTTITFHDGENPNDKNLDSNDENYGIFTKLYFNAVNF